MSTPNRQLTILSVLALLTTLSLGACKKGDDDQEGTTAEEGSGEF